MAYNQNKNPFQIKSPLNHNLKEKKTGTPYNHFHDPKNQSNIYSSDQKVVSGSNKFGGNKANRRFYDKKLDERVSETDLAREYASQLANMYNSGQVTEGQFLADDLYNRKRKLSFKNGKIKLKSGRMEIDEGSMFNTKRGIANEDGGYTIPENQYTEDQIYDMMVQGGGLVSIVDGQIVSGNPNEVMSEGYDKANAIKTFSNDFQDKYYDSTRLDNIREEGIEKERKLAELRKNLLDEKKAKIDEASEIARGIIARGDRNSPVNNNSPLHQEQEIDPKTGQPKENYEYNEGVQEVGETTEELIYNEDGSIKGTSFKTPTTTTFTGAETIENVEEIPPSPPNDRPDFKEDCEGIVMNMDNISKSGFYKCNTAPSPPGGGTTPPGVIEEDITNTDTYSTVNYDERFEPVEPTPIPEGASDLFNLRGASKNKKGFELPLPTLDFSDLIFKAGQWLEPKIGKSGKQGCGCAVNPR